MIFRNNILIAYRDAAAAITPALLRVRNVYTSCGGYFKAEEFDWEAIDNMGKTNPTQQRGHLEKRVSVKTCASN